MPMFHVFAHNPTADDAKRHDDIFVTERFALAQATADHHKTLTGRNAYIESRSVVYVTSTLDEALKEDAAHRAALRKGGETLGALFSEPLGTGDAGTMRTYDRPA